MPHVLVHREPPTLRFNDLKARSGVQIGRAGERSGHQELEQRSGARSTFARPPAFRQTP